MSRGRRRRLPSWLPMALASVVCLAPLAVAPAQGQGPPPPSSCDGDRRSLKADAEERLRQIEALRTMLAASERALKANQALLEAMRAQYREEVAGRRRSDARKDEALARARESLRAAKAAAERESTRAAGLAQTAETLRGQLDRLRADHRKLGAELSSLRKAQEKLDRSHVAALAAEAKRLGERLAQAEQERMRALAALEAELTAARERERNSRATARDLERTLREERQASQSKLEALESVLKNTRSASAGLRSRLDDARTRNTDLARQVKSLESDVRKVHELQASFRQKNLRLQELEQRKDADPAELQALRSERSSVAADFRRARSAQVASAASVSRWMKAEEPRFAPVPASAGAGNEQEADLREQLSLERERRETLEEEVKRLTTSGDNEERFVEVWNALQSARSQILVLTNQLADERRNRETLEVALTRLKQESGAEGQSTTEFATRLAATLEERRAEADRLAGQLKDAKEAIVRLKGRLEAAGAGKGEQNLLEEVSRENLKLREALKGAEEANRSLRAKAEMAARLAEMVYGASP